MPTINDGYTGKAPDIGAFEVGTPMFHYGPRAPVPGSVPQDKNSSAHGPVNQPRMILPRQEREALLRHPNRATGRLLSVWSTSKSTKS